jgi:hypothetical protein
LFFCFFSFPACAHFRISSLCLQALNVLFVRYDVLCDVLGVYRVRAFGTAYQVSAV